MAPVVLAGCAKVFTSHLSARSPGIQRWTKQLAAGWEDAFLYIAAIPSGTQKCAVKIRENRSLAGVCKSVYRYDSGRYTYLHKKITFLTTNLPKYYDYAEPGKQKWAVNIVQTHLRGYEKLFTCPILALLRTLISLSSSWSFRGVRKSVYRTPSKAGIRICTVGVIWNPCTIPSSYTAACIGKRNCTVNECWPKKGYAKVFTTNGTDQLIVIIETQKPNIQ